MKSPSKTAAQQRADQIQAFNIELAELERDQVLSLTLEQQHAIGDYQQGLFKQFRSNNEIDANPREKQLSLGMRIASFLGAVALAASVFFLLHQLWGRLGTVSQVTILVGASTISFLAAVIVGGRDFSCYFTKLITKYA